MKPTALELPGYLIRNLAVVIAVICMVRLPVSFRKWTEPYCFCTNPDPAAGLESRGYVCGPLVDLSPGMLARTHEPNSVLDWQAN